jgi:hypothetical protein
VRNGNGTKVDEVASLEMSELGVSSEIELGRFAYLGFKRKRTDQLIGFPIIQGQQGTQGCSRGYDCSAATSDDASTTTPSEYVWSR